jgi:hypothetical protein|tara:strand:+ start:3607 stop:3777 length:171 start_codon:yes stop_codon:yes gene_type:complete
MVEIVGDSVQPSEFVVPTIENDRNLSGNNVSGGDMFMSGAKIWFHNGTEVVVVTSG